MKRKVQDSQQQRLVPLEPFRVRRNVSHLTEPFAALESGAVSGEELPEYNRAFKKWRKYFAPKAAMEMASASKDEHGVPTPDAALKAEMRSAFAAAVKTRTAVASTEKDDQKDDQKEYQKDDQKDGQKEKDDHEDDQKDGQKAKG